jgi:hypothetical protein
MTRKPKIPKRNHLSEIFDKTHILETSSPRNCQQVGKAAKPGTVSSGWLSQFGHNNDQDDNPKRRGFKK